MSTATLSGGGAKVGGGIDTSLLLQAISPGVAAALQDISLREVEAIQQDISVPVERGPDGRVTVRSAPGEPPRTEEGVLLMHVEGHIEQGESGLPELAIIASRPPDGGDDQSLTAVILEEGGMNQDGRYVAPRPFMTPALVRVEQYAAAALAAKFKG